MGEMLKGRVAVITGAGNGLGRADAISFAAQGARVVVNDLGTSYDGHGASHNDADLVVGQIRQAGGVAVPNYSTVKEGIVGFARTVAREMAPCNTTCNVLRPIAVWRGVVPGAVKNPLYEANKPEDVAALATCLVSESADPINGCIFEVFHGHAGIFVEPAPLKKTLTKDGSWTAEELMEQIPKTLTAGLSREEFPFTLPDIFKSP